jgi:hypothetical protein
MKNFALRMMALLGHELPVLVVPSGWAHHDASRFYSSRNSASSMMIFNNTRLESHLDPCVNRILREPALWIRNGGSNIGMYTQRSEARKMPNSQLLSALKSECLDEFRDYWEQGDEITEIISPPLRLDDKDKIKHKCWGIPLQVFFDYYQRVLCVTCFRINYLFFLPFYLNDTGILTFNILL